MPARADARLYVCVYMCVCMSFITEWIAGKDLEETVYSLRKTSRLFGATVCLASWKGTRKRGKRKCGEVGVGVGGGGRTR